MSLWHYVSNTPVAHDISFKVGTDALVCPKHPNIGSGQTKASVPTLWRLKTLILTAPR